MRPLILLLVLLTLYSVKIRSERSPESSSTSLSTQIDVDDDSGYPNSPCFLLFRNIITGKELRQCGNFAQFMNKKLPISPEMATPIKLHQWVTNTTDFCLLGKNSAFFTTHLIKGEFENSVVPLLFRQNSCVPVLNSDHSSNISGIRGMGFISSEDMRREVARKGAAASLFLMRKGQFTRFGFQDYLFFDFYDPTINISTGIPTFFMYESIFNDVVKELGGDYESIELRAYRPEEYPYVSLLLQMGLAFGSVLAGSIWTIFSKRMSPEKFIEDHIKAQKEKRSKKEEEARISSSTDEETELETKPDSAAKRFYIKHKESIHTVVNTVSPLISIAIFATLIILFRSFMLILLNLGMCVYAAVATAVIVRSLVSNCSTRLGSSYIVSGATFVMAFAACLYWFYNRKSPYAFIQLNIMNCLTAAFLMYSVHFAKLKIPCYLLIALFVYDVFMVFGTRLFLECSLMEQMAVGGCGIAMKKMSNLSYVPPPNMFYYAPIMPAILQVPRISPMFSCFDVDVERHFPVSILGLGDVIIPGFFICYSFRMVGITRPSRLLYGTIGLFGYVVGLALAMLIVLFVKSAQPALLYLVPCVLVPVILTIFLRGDLPVAWNGVDTIELPDVSDEDTTTSDGATV